MRKLMELDWRPAKSVKTAASPFLLKTNVNRNKCIGKWVKKNKLYADRLIYVQQNQSRVQNRGIAGFIENECKSY